MDYPFFGGEPERGAPPAATLFTGSLPPRPQGSVKEASTTTAASGAVTSSPLAPPQQAEGEDYFIVTAQEGDTVYSLSRRYDASARAIFALNDMRETDALRPGQQVRIPKAKMAARMDEPPVLGVHRVRAGETLPSIAKLYQVSAFQIAELNDIKPSEPLRVGQDLRIPANGKTAQQARPVKVASLNPAAGSAAATIAPLPPERPRQTGAAPDKSAKSESDKRPLAAPPLVAATDAARSAAGAPPSRTVLKRRARQVASIAKLPEPAPMTGAEFRWPVRGRIISEFGGKPSGGQNDGINIAVPAGTSIKAAENGVVAYVGNELKGYGNLILVQHDKDLVTAYAHAGEISVKRGDQVARGQIIGKAGQTGAVNQPQLHFEVRKGSKPVDPMAYMTKN